jgi:BirA family transcriptional regulator, biotin operon repressor / biotin---[acetyl-CoA-carboxylase] ligase
MMDFHSFANCVLERCHSTNDLAKELAQAGFPHGTWVSSRIQETGRGRLGRRWESLEGNLFLSIIVRISSPHLWSWVPLTTATGIVRCLQERYSGLNFQIKWPNDIWLNRAKLGGILCEGGSDPAGAFIVIGIGINCISSPQGLDQATTDLSRSLCSEKIMADMIRIPILLSVLKEVENLVLHGPAKVAESYENWAAFRRGTSIVWGKPSQNGWVEGLGSSGELQVRSMDGSFISLYAEDINASSG